MTAPFMVTLLLMAALLVALVEVNALSFVYERLGISREWASGLLFGSIIGAWVNIPVARFEGSTHVDHTDVQFMGVRYTVPQVVHTDETVLAVNVGGAVIPSALAGYLIVHDHLGWRAVLAVAVVSLLVHLIARPVKGVGVVVPTLVPAILAVVTAEIIGGNSIAALAFVGGTLGTLLGADISNLPQMRKWGAPVVAIGGAGTFDGIFVTGVVAVLLASL